MKRFLTLIIIFISLRILAQPIFYVENPHINFGNVIQKSEVHGEILIENRGNEVLEFKEVVPYCNCTILSMPNSMQPGDKGKIVFSITPKIAEGNWRTVIKIITNEPKDNVHKLNITMNVIPLIKFEPVLKEPIVLLPEEDLDTTFRIFSPAKMTFSIHEFFLKPEDTAIIEPIDLIGEKITPDKDFKFKIKSTKPIKIGENFFNIRVKTDIKNLPTSTYLFKVTVKDYIWSEPEILKFNLNAKPGIIKPSAKDKYAYLNPQKNAKPSYKLKEEVLYKVEGSINGWYQILNPENNLVLWVPWEDSIVMDNGFQANTKIFSAKNIPFKIVEVKCPEKFRCFYKEEKEGYVLFVQRIAPLEHLAENFGKVQIITDHPKKEILEIPLSETKIEKYQDTKEKIDRKLKLEPKYRDKKLKDAQPKIKMENK